MDRSRQKTGFFSESPPIYKKYKLVAVNAKLLTISYVYPSFIFKKKTFFNFLQ
jgi:hypothetical protein